MLKGFTRNFRPLEVLTEEQVDAIWRGILEVLEHTGLEFETEKALKIFDKGGCKVDYDNRRVRFPPGLVTECLRKCPSSFRLEARDPENDIVIGGNAVYVHPGPGMRYVDIDTFEPREATKKEFYDAVTVYDALPNLHILHGNSPNFSFEGVPPIMATIESYAARARNSTKVNGMSCSFGNHVFNIEIAKVVGAKGLWGAGASAPLAWNDDAISGTISAIEAGIPVGWSSGGIWGASAPATIAGQIITASAEVMGPLVLTQLIDPGHPVDTKLFTFPQNMRTGAPFFDNITIGLSNAAFHQVWRRYSIPTFSIEASIPSSKCMDFQSGYEKGMIALASAISGSHVVWIHGTIHGEVTAHPVQAIMDDDIAGMIGRFLEGVTVNDETLAIDLIKEVGPIPGFYLNKEHTRKWWQKEQFIPAVADILTLPEWIKEGKKTTIDLAKEKMEEILATHKVSIPLTASQEEDIERILAEARKFYKEKI
jgi:trimethylamine--corrinoid protein Co-methyltransferase